ncbi:hypothetical protein NDU88_007548 [Pleurodeles waltl]|uniref:Uncharacterized protein n=1 Tax=Pleurodeles waltl TaxID=8319 RepID=A0AAV7NWA3_PLEWA|nr:hypothetical protein NDU88_007548 [Pleurodeles waltl]
MMAKKAEWACTRRAETCDDGTCYGQEELNGGDWGCDPGPDPSGAPKVPTQRPGDVPARGHAGSRTAAREESRNTYGCRERNRPGGETRRLTWQRSGEWERPRVENQPNNRPACRSDRRQPSPALESPDNRAHHTKSPAAFTTAELREDALVLGRRFGLS